jgi:SsrA-binding protein
VSAVKKLTKKTIVLNRKATHDYFIEERIEAGLVLQGWEVKSLRSGRAQLKESYVLIKRSEAFLFGAHLSPLQSVATHIPADPIRNRKLLLHRKELNKLIGKVKEKGYTLVPLALYWSKGKIKCEIGIAKGKKQHDKRETIKQRDWEREKARVLRRT